MTVIPQFHAPGITPLALAEALTQRDVGFGDFLGANFREGILNSPIIGPTPPPLFLGDEGWAEERRQELIDFRAVNRRDPTPDEMAGIDHRLQRWQERESERLTPITQEEWQQSEHFREDIPWEEGMSEERAASLAEFYDETKFNQWLIANHEGVGWGISTVSGFLAGVAGGALDPSNYIPFAGPAIRAAAVARLGVIGGRAAVGAFEGALGTALAMPVIAQSRAQIGEQMTFADMALDIAMGAMAGSAFGAVHGTFAARREARFQAGTDAILTDLRVANEAVTKVEIARRQVSEGRFVDVPEVSARSREALFQGLTLRERVRTEAAREGMTPRERVEFEAAREAPEPEPDQFLAEQAFIAEREPRTRLTETEERAVRGKSQAERDVARQALDKGHESFILERDGAQFVAERGSGGQVIADRNGQAFIAERGTTRGVKNLTRLERMAISDPSPRVKALARIEVDRRLRPARPHPPAASEPVPVKQQLADMEADMEAEGPELAQYADLEKAGDLTDAEKAEMAAAVEAEQKAANANEAYIAAVRCALA